MKRNRWLVGLLAMLLCLSACQPTPEEAIVVSKQDNVVETVADTDADQLSEIPADIQEPLREMTPRLYVEVDASISTPESGKVPLARLSRQNIDPETGTKWLNALADGRRIYYIRTFSDYSVQELTEMIDYIRSNDAAPARAYLMDDFNPISTEDAIESIQHYLPNAPITPQYHYYAEGDAILSRQFEFESSHQVCAAEIANGYTAFRYLCYDSIPAQGSVHNLSMETQGGVTISVEDAQVASNQLIESMGLSDFALNGIGVVPYLDLATGQENTYQELPKCYRFFYTKQIGGMNETYVDPSYVNVFNREESYNLVWQPEYIAVTVSDEGVIAAECPEYPSQVELIEENIEILDFDTILDRFYDQIQISGCWMDVDDDAVIAKRTIKIDEIVLGGLRIIEKNEDTYLFIPVWSFFGSVTSEYYEGEGDLAQLNENHEFSYTDYRQCILTLSAIDGSVIDRAQGY